MWMVWFLVMLVGVSLLLSLFDRPPAAVFVSLVEDEASEVVCRSLGSPDASSREISGGNTR
jgi:hypothetical protein